MEAHAWFCRVHGNQDASFPVPALDGALEALRDRVTVHMIRRRVHTVQGGPGEAVCTRALPAGVK